MNWGRRKKELVITIQGNLTTKQFEEVERRMLKICDKFDLGFQASDELWELLIHSQLFDTDEELIE